MTRWSPAAATAWFGARPLPLGCNYVPATAVNTLEMWQAATFDAATIDRELALAAGLGMNAVRVFLHDLLWADPAGCIGRLDAFLTLAARHGIAVMPVLFESCWDPAPVAGPQPSPRPGIHNSRWVQSPGAAALADPASAPRLHAYVAGVVAAFARDPRVLAWDIWNEPDNGPEVDARDAATLARKADEVLPLLAAAFGWARAAGATQPLTSAVWSGDWSQRGAWSAIQRCQLDESDIASFHNYDGAAEFGRRVGWLAALGRPLLCTEYMARPRGSTIVAIAPVARAASVGLFNWGLVRGRTQTHLPWDSWTKPYLGETPEPWFHDLLDGDGSCRYADEAAVLRGEATGDDAGRSDPPGV